MSRKITKISYFTDDRERWKRLTGFWFSVQEILNDQRCKVKGRDTKELSVTFWEPGNRYKRMHDFLVYPDKDKFLDLTCNKNCPHMVAMALMMKWIKLPKTSIEVSPWMHFKMYGKARIELKDGNYVVRYKDKYTNILLCDNTIIGLKNALILRGKMKGWSNLKTNNYEWILDLAKKEVKKRNAEDL